MFKKIISYRQKILSTPFKILVTGIFKIIKHKINNFSYFKSSISKNTIIGDKDFLRELNIKMSLNEYKQSLIRMIMNHNFLNSIFNLSQSSFILSKVTKKSEAEIIELADNICLHKFNILGSGEALLSNATNASSPDDCFYQMNNSKKELSQIKKIIKNKGLSILKDKKEYQAIMLDYDYKPIDWQLDFKSGYKWQKDMWYKNIKYGEFIGADIKIPWELSRFQHFNILGMAYISTKNEKYFLEYMYQLIDWVENNHPQFGVNWKCNMDVAIRAANWVCGLSFFRYSKLINQEFLFYVIKNLYIHGKHIFNNLENHFVTSNHYFANISGLIFLAEFFNKSPIGKKWEIFSINELKKETKKQIYSDGVNFEGSTCYHRLVLELLFFPVIYLVKNSGNFSGGNFKIVARQIFGKDLVEKIYKMFNFVLFSLKPNGLMPQIGDNDNGRFLIFGIKELLDMRYLLCLGAIFFKEPKFKIKEFGFINDALWIYGEKGYEVWNKLENNYLKKINSKYFPVGGLFIMRNEDNYLCLSCGPNGQNGNGGHAHNDKLSFELSIKGKDVFIDPGTYCYTPFPEWRNNFRSTSFHNTVEIDNEEQNRFIPGNLFSLKNEAKIEISNIYKKKDYDIIEAIHYGYKRLNKSIIHKRKILFNKIKSFYFFKDEFIGSGNHIFKIYFHISVGGEVKINKNTLISTIDVFGIPKIRIIPLNKEKLSLEIQESWISPEYGIKRSSSVVRYLKEDTAPTDISFYILNNEENIPRNMFNNI